MQSLSLKQRLKKVREAISQAEIDNHRGPDGVLLVAVSKQQSSTAIMEAHRLGLCHFAENYLQEAQKKMEQLQALPLSWHFIGPIQSNKAKRIAHLFDWVQSIDSEAIAKALSKHREPQKKPLQVCLQIKLVEEKSKSGLLEEEAFKLAKIVSTLPNLQLRGLMTIPPLQDVKANYQLFLQLKQLLGKMNQEFGLKMDILSMGMSDDYVWAIKAGSTLVRIGRAIFGERK